MRDSKIKAKHIFTILVFVVFVLTIVVNIGHSSMWGDEWTDYTFSRADIASGELDNLIFSTVLSPPLYYYVMHAWLLISPSVIWFRLFNVLIGFISAIFLYLGIKRKCNGYYGEISVLILALCFQWVYCFQEGSEYGFMLFFLFGALYFFLRATEGYQYRFIIPFVLFCVGGIWTHYGAVFVALPLLLFFFIGTLINKDKNIKDKAIVAGIYVLSFVCFAIPLVKKYLLTQMAFNSLSSHVHRPTLSWFIESVFDFGRIVGFLFSVNNGTIRNEVLGALSVFLIVMCLYVMVKTKDMGNRLLILVLVLCYAMHFGLVKMQYYAMLHENMTSGFYSRYSYFYIPLLAFVFPIVIKEIIDMGGRLSLTKYVFLVTGIWFVVVSVFHIAPNWNKSYDKEFAKIWMDNHAWEDASLIYYCGWDGFNYYLPRQEGFKPEYLANSYKVIEVNNEFPTLPENFWLWRTNWDSDEWNEVITRARDEGYFVKVFLDYGFDGQLAYCSLSNKAGYEPDSYSFSVEGVKELDNSLVVDLYCDRLDAIIEGSDFIDYAVKDRFNIPLRGSRKVENIKKLSENRLQVTIDTSDYVYDHYRVSFRLSGSDIPIDDNRIIEPNVSLNF